MEKQYGDFLSEGRHPGLDVRKIKEKMLGRASRMHRGARSPISHKDVNALKGPSSDGGDQRRRKHLERKK